MTSGTMCTPRDCGDGGEHGHGNHVDGASSGQDGDQRSPSQSPFQQQHGREEQKDRLVEEAPQVGPPPPALGSRRSDSRISRLKASRSCPVDRGAAEQGRRRGIMLPSARSGPRPRRPPVRCGARDALSRRRRREVVPIGAGSVKGQHRVRAHGVPGPPRLPGRPFPSITMSPSTGIARETVVRPARRARRLPRAPRRRETTARRQRSTPATRRFMRACRGRDQRTATAPHARAGRQTRPPRSPGAAPAGRPVGDRHSRARLSPADLFGHGAS